MSSSILPLLHQGDIDGIKQLFHSDEKNNNNNNDNILYDKLLNEMQSSPSTLSSSFSSLSPSILSSFLSILFTITQSRTTSSHDFSIIASFLSESIINNNNTNNNNNNNNKSIKMNGHSSTSSSPTSSSSPSPSKKSRPTDLKSRMELVLQAFRNGEFVVVVDAADRENEGDLIIAADKVTPDKIAFMVRETSGLLCIAMEGKRLDELKLPQMVEKNTESHSTAFTVSCDYKIGTTTGISAGDRAATIRALVDPTVSPNDFNRPGHMFPLRAREGGVLIRPGHTESAVDLCRLSGCYPAGVICEIVKHDGSMMRPGDLDEFADKNQLQIIDIADIIQYRKLYDNNTNGNNNSTNGINHSS